MQTTDLVQIGPILISKAVFDVLAPLIGTIIGGAITFFSTRAIELRKWRLDRGSKFKESQREALVLALEWLDPITHSLITTSLLAPGVLLDRLPKEQIRQQWPNLLSELAKRDLPPRFRYLLPDNLQGRGLSIVRGLDDLKHFVMSSNSLIDSEEQFHQSFEELSQRIAQLHSVAESLERDLVEAYRETFK